MYYKLSQNFRLFFYFVIEAKKKRGFQGKFKRDRNERVR